MIAIHSLRGGTGCSSLAVNLGVGFVYLWKKPAVLLDLTMTAGQVALMLNMTLRRTWTDIARFELGRIGFQHAQFHYLFPRKRTGFCCRANLSFASRASSP